tara:strand:- start:131 stop:832 length:702 start_codon:yes stop_codon:yes gene_type:complete
MNDFLSIIEQKNFIEKIKIKNKSLIIFDVGSYKGTFSKQVIKKFGHKNIIFYLFDPLKQIVNFDNEVYKNFNYYDYALDSKKPGIKKFYLNNFLHASGSSLNGNSFKDRQYKFSRNLIAFFLNPFKKMVKIIKVKTNNLDNFCKQKKIKNIDILKIDTEGTELDVLNGSKKILKKTKLVCIEVQCSKNEFDNKVKKIEKLLGKNFDLIYKKRILIASLFTGIVSYDYIYSQKI